MHKIQVFTISFAIFAISACASQPTTPVVTIPETNQVPRETPSVHTERVPEPPTPELPPELLEARKQLEQAQYTEAEKILVTYLEAHPESYDALGLRAKLLEKEKKFPLAELTLQKALEIQGDNLELHMQLANIHFQEEKFGLALEETKKILEKEPSFDAAYALQVRIYLGFLDYKNAAVAAKNAYQIKNSAQNILNYADTLYAIQDYQEATKQYEEFLKIPQMPLNAVQNAAENLAQIYELHLQNPDRACYHYLKLTEIDPNNLDYQASKNFNCAPKP